MAKTNWKYKVMEKDGKRCEWSNPRSGRDPEVAADIGVYEKGELLTVITVMGLNDKKQFPNDEALKAHIRSRALQEIEAQAKREEAKETEHIPVFQDDMEDSFDLTKIKEGRPI